MSMDTFEVDYDGEITTVEALDEEDAAATFAERYFHNGDCVVPDGIVRVRQLGDEAWSKFRCEGESYMHFSASEVDP